MYYYSLENHNMKNNSYVKSSIKRGKELEILFSLSKNVAKQHCEYCCISKQLLLINLKMKIVFVAFPCMTHSRHEKDFRLKNSIINNHYIYLVLTYSYHTLSVKIQFKMYCPLGNIISYHL